MSGRQIFDLVDRVTPLFEASSAELWVSERADVALACEAQGLQIPEAGLSVVGARRVAWGSARDASGPVALCRDYVSTSFLPRSH